MDGFYASEATARRALGLSASELKELYPIWTREGRNRPVTWDDLDRIERARPARPLRGFACAVVVPVLVGLGAAGLIALPPTASDLPRLAVGAVVLFGALWFGGHYLSEVRHCRAGFLTAGARSRTWAALRPSVAVSLAQRAGVPSPLDVGLVAASIAMMVGSILAAILFS